MQELWLHHKDLLLDKASTNSQAEGAQFWCCVYTRFCAISYPHSLQLCRVCANQPCALQTETGNCVPFSPKPNFPQINFPTAETNYYWNLSQIELSGWDFRYPRWDLNNFWFPDWALKTEANIKYCPQNVTTETWLRLTDFVTLSVIVSFGYFLTCLCTVSVQTV